MSKNTKHLLLAGVVAGMSILLISCSSQKSSGSADASTAIPVVDSQNTFHAEGKVVPRQFSSLAFYPNAGKIGEILVKEGDQVKSGQSLVKLAETESLDAELASARQAEVDAQKALDDLNNKADMERGLAYQNWRNAEKTLTDAEKVLNDLDDQDYQDDLADLEDDVKDAKDDLDDAQEELDKYINLDSTNNKRKDAQETYNEKKQDYQDAVYNRNLKINELDRAKADVDAASGTAANAQKEYEDKLKGPDPDDLARMQAALDTAQAQVKAAEKAVEDATLTAPYDGTIVDLYHFTTGDTVSAGVPVVEIADLSSLYVETKDLTEIYVVKIHEGDTVAVSADALPGMDMQGVIESIKPVYGEYSGDVVYTVRIKLLDPAAGLRWGMTVDTVYSSEPK